MPEEKMYTQDELDGEVAGLKAKNIELLIAQKDFKVKLAKFDGLDVARLTALEQAEKDRETTNAKKRGDWEALSKKKDEDHLAALMAKDKAIAARDVKLEDALVGEAVTRAITEAEGNSLLLDHIVRAQVRLEDGQAVVVDAEGTRRLGDKGDHLTITELVNEFKRNDAYAGAFAGTGSRGSGTPTGTGRGRMPSGTVDASDPDAMGKNLHGILDGTIIPV
jgi:hypothetical protein